MSGKNKRFFAVFLLLVIILTLSPINVFAGKSEEVQAPSEKENLFCGKDCSDVAKNTNVKKVKSKLDTKLSKLIGRENMDPNESKESLEDQMKLLNQFVPKGGCIKVDKSIAEYDVVFVYVKTLTSEGVKSVEPYIYKEVNIDPDNKILSAWVQVDKLEKLETLDEVLNIETVIQPKVNATSEGDSLHRANMVRSLSNGTDGIGVKVGVISDGVDHLNDSIALGDLDKSKTHVLSNNCGGDEGTAMLEIIHDLAPGAELYFHDASTDCVGFNKAIDALVAAGCKIIVDDIDFITVPYFEDGIISTHVKQVVNNYDINYITAAGNDAKNHYQGTYYNDGNNCHDFSAGKSENKGIYVNIEPGETVQVVLQWDDPMGGSYNDYDLFMCDTDTKQELSNSSMTQDGYSDPIEAIEYTNNKDYDINAEIVVKNPNGKAHEKTLELFVFGGNCYKNNIVESDSIIGHAAVPDVITVGGIDVSQPNEIAPYSSQGPVTIRNGATRQKPDICGATGVSVSGVGGFSTNFSGTSAAAPHIAAIAALLRSKYPTKTAKQIRDLIQNNAVDLGKTGVDNIFGHGRADAYNSFTAASSTDVSTLSIKRLAGQNRIETSIAIAKEEFSDKKPDSVVITTSSNFPDALSGANLAYNYNAPIILVNSTVSDSKNSLDYINNNLAKGKYVYILGGNGVVSTEISDYISSQGYSVVRIGGNNRYETNQKIFNNINPPEGNPIVIATGESFADALSISGIAAMDSYPILLNTKETLLNNVRRDIINIKPSIVYIVGGTGVISNNVETEIKSINKNINIVRFDGIDRYDTSIKIGDYFNLNTDNIVLATGGDFPDALSGALLAATKNSGILLVKNSDVYRQEDYISRHKIKNISILGGEGVIRNDTIDSLSR